jgi:hypothetical protein
MQADVDHLYEMFLELSSQNRGMTVEELRATKADIYRGSLAVEAGLADEVGTLDEALEAFAAHVDDLQTSGGAVLSKSQLRVGMMVAKQGKTVVSADAGTETGAVVEPGAAGTETETVVEPVTPEPVPANDDVIAAAVDRAVKAESARCSGLHAVAEQASRLGVNFNALEAISKGMSVAAAREKVMSAAADGDADETSAIAVPKNKSAAGGAQTHTAEQKQAMWAKAIKRR